ncbi:MAG: hypothetical protein AAFY56_06375 [Pseudomonadota bacterium]
MNSSLNRRVEQFENAIPNTDDPFGKMMAMIPKMTPEERKRALKLTQEYQ